LGSIPQQDVFQRVTSAKDERTAVRGSLLGGTLYFCFCFVPMYLAYAATLIDPGLFNTLLAQDSQLVLPTLILSHTPVFAQVIFFGAVLSAVMSCASATLLAPSVILSENVIKGVLPHLSDREFLRVMRLVVVIFAVLVLTIALTSSSSIYQLVVGTYEVTLVAAFVPLCAGLFWSRATTQGAMCAFVAGLTTWIGLGLFTPSGSIWHPQLVGLLMAVAGMFVGSLLPQKIGTRS
jgi:solute:Na+ symporter, SSS family